MMMHHNHIKPISVNDNDVLSGRGNSINNHPGNERFRTLVKVYRDDEYCTSYSMDEKRAVAKEVIVHIHSLDPPGRFLKLEAKSLHKTVWSILSDYQVIQKTCQALRDCNRLDRSGYATTVVSPLDVMTKAENLSKTGLTIKQRASAAAFKEAEKKMLFKRLAIKQRASAAAFKETEKKMLLKNSYHNEAYYSNTNRLSRDIMGAHDNYFDSPPPPMTSLMGVSYGIDSQHPSSVAATYGIDSQHLQSYYPDSNSVVPFSPVHPMYPQTTAPVNPCYQSFMSSRNHAHQEVQSHLVSPFNSSSMNNNTEHILPIDSIQSSKEHDSERFEHSYQGRIYPRY